MGLFYRATNKELLETRKNIFLDRGVPMLYKNGFEKSPFSTAWFGKDNTGSYSYEFCKLTDNSLLQIVTVHIVRGDRWIQINLNIFKIGSNITAFEQLNKVDGLQFHLPPNSLSMMRLNIDDYKGSPLFNRNSNNHKIKCYWTKHGFKRNAKKLSARIESDLAAFNKFVIRWNQLHRPITTTPEGKIEGLNNMTVEERLSASGLLAEFNKSMIKDKVRAIRILEWLQVDKASINKIVKE